MKKVVSRQIMVGEVPVGGGAPVTIQSMTNTDTRNAAATLAQIREVAEAGCEIIRVAVPDEMAVAALPEIIAGSPIPVIADIHFDYRLALGAMGAGIHGIRINPGNIGGADQVRKVAEAAAAQRIPLRVGANSGSLQEGLLEEKLRRGIPHTQAMAEALVDSALEECAILEKHGFDQIKVSLKASDVAATFAACRMWVERSDYPLHLGVTEAGTPKRGIIKSAAGIGGLLLLGIGDTIRVSLTASPVEEVKAAKILLESVGLRQASPEIVSCPTCGRTEIDLIVLAGQVESMVESLQAQGKKIKLRKIAVMGCVVNGPGEAKDADLGITGGKDKIILFRKGETLGVFPVAAGLARFQEELLASCVL